MLRRNGLLTIGLMLAAFVGAWHRTSAQSATSVYLLKPARIFDGEQLREGFGVIVRGDKIEAVAPFADLKATPMGIWMPKSSNCPTQPCCPA